MTRRTKLLIFTPLILAGSAFSQFSIGPQWVWDPTAIAKIGEEILKINDQTQKVITVGRNTQATFETLKSDAQVIQNRGFFRGYSLNALLNSGTPNQSGATGGWVQAVNHNLQTVNGWSGSAMSAYYNPSLLESNPSFKAYAAGAEISQGAATTAMSTLGQARTVQAQMQGPIAACEGRSLSTASEDNTRGGLQNVTNGCLSLQVRQSQTQLAIDASRLELELANTKRNVDALNEHLTNWSRTTELNQTESTGIQFSSAERKAFRLP